MSMPSKWLDKTQPQTLYIATLLMYINGFFGILFVGSYVGAVILGVHHLALGIDLALVAGQVVGAWGIANEKRWAYALAVVVAVVLLASTVLGFSGGSLLNLIFEVALVALLLHPQSREYRSIWFH
jgi:dolichol kinase